MRIEYEGFVVSFVHKSAAAQIVVDGVRRVVKVPIPDQLFAFFDQTFKQMGEQLSQFPECSDFQITLPHR